MPGINILIVQNLTLLILPFSYRVNDSRNLC
uniref:Uncharacterized protein n=1 Tax=Rhizophora mucronata TaxID=61149 RepID=A0A2P2IUN7_RHIMU